MYSDAAAGKRRKKKKTLCVRHSAAAGVLLDFTFHFPFPSTLPSLHFRHLTPDAANMNLYHVSETADSQPSTTAETLVDGFHAEKMTGQNDRSQDQVQTLHGSEELAMFARCLEDVFNKVKLSTRLRRMEPRTAAAAEKQQRTRKIVRRIARVVKPPAPIGAIPRMLDQLKRRSSHLLLRSPDGSPNGPVHRIPAHVRINSAGVRQILAHWNGRSAFAADTDTVSDAKLSLLVWRPPSISLVAAAAAAAAAPPPTVEAWHVIPVTQLEAARFHHIPVEMRESMIPEELRHRIHCKLAAIVVSAAPPTVDVE